jgi:hypothetical protein
VHGNALWVSNTDKGTVVRIPVLPTIDDFAFTGNEILAAVNHTNTVVRIRQDGTETTVLTGTDGLQNPTSIVLRGGVAYVFDAAYVTHTDPNVLRARYESRADRSPTTMYGCGFGHSDDRNGEFGVGVCAKTGEAVRVQVDIAVHDEQVEPGRLGTDGSDRGQFADEERPRSVGLDLSDVCRVLLKDSGEAGAGRDDESGTSATFPG